MRMQRDREEEEEEEEEEEHNTFNEFRPQSDDPTCDIPDQILSPKAHETQPKGEAAKSHQPPNASIVYKRRNRHRGGDTRTVASIQQSQQGVGEILPSPESEVAVTGATIASRILVARLVTVGSSHIRVGEKSNPPHSSPPFVSDAGVVAVASRHRSELNGVEEKKKENKEGEEGLVQKGRERRREVNEEGEEDFAQRREKGEEKKSQRKTKEEKRYVAKEREGKREVSGRVLGKRAGGRN